VPTKDPGPLRAFKKQIGKRKKSNERTIKLRLFPNSRFEEEKLFDIGLAYARLWNELNYEKSQAFLRDKLSPGKRDEINKRYYHRYKEMLGVNADRLLIRMRGLGTYYLSYWI
jgi:hypothetical protein